LLNGIEPEKFYQNQAYAFAGINFYTAKYDNGSKIVPEDIAGYDPDASYAAYLVFDAFRGSIGNLYIGEGSEN
jgi:hypothetical protein